MGAQILQKKTFSNSMADVLTKTQRSNCMAAIRSSGNKDTEIRLITILRGGKFKGWRRNSSLFGRPDFVFPKIKLAVFVDGCFWHGCPRCYRSPKSNKAFWSEKKTVNHRRDVLVNRSLRAKGWRVIRFWECDLGISAKILFKLKNAMGELKDLSANRF
jgi:DNA mismatch endonuclease, patch repair protein